MSDERKHLIGGTDAGDLLGIGHTSPTTLYLRLRGEIPDDFEGNEATAAGKLFEDRVAVELVREKHGLNLARPARRVLTLPDEPRIGCSLDFDVVPAGAGVLDNLPVAEIKLTGSRKMWGELERVPPVVGAQAQFQMAVARASGKRVIPVVHVIAMFVPGFITEDFEIEEDQEVGSVLLESARAMLRRVDAGEPPDPKDAEDARRIFLGRMGQTHLCTDFELSLMTQLREVKAAKKISEKAEKEILDALLPAFGDATEIVDPNTGEVLATWRPSQAFHADAFADQCPELFQQYRKMDVDVTRLRKEQPKTAAQFSWYPEKASEGVRQFRMAKMKEGR